MKVWDRAAPFVLLVSVACGTAGQRQHPTSLPCVARDSLATGVRTLVYSDLDTARTTGDVSGMVLELEVTPAVRRARCESLRASWDRQ